MSKTGTTASFTYNADGLRVQKTVNNVVTNYTLHGKNVVHLTQGSDSLHFFYDAQNRPAIVEWNNGVITAKYAYIHNLQGDIVGIVDSNGTEVVKYAYDAWGKVLSTTGSLASTLGTIQPCRYRGYVYDVETGHYYLRSRYSYPDLCRFLNADRGCCNSSSKYYRWYNCFFIKWFHSLWLFPICRKLTQSKERGETFMKRFVVILLIIILILMTCGVYGESLGDDIWQPSWGELSICGYNDCGNSYDTLLNSSGEILLPLQQQFLTFIPFNEDIAFLMLIEENLGKDLGPEKFAICTKNKLVTGFDYTHVNFDPMSPLDPILCCKANSDDYLFGYIDTDGKWIIEPQYKYAEVFRNGIAYVEFVNGDQCYINAEGEVVEIKYAE